MTIAEGLAFTGLVFIFAAGIFGMCADIRRNDLAIPGWIAFVLAIASWLAAIWTGVLT